MTLEVEDFVSETVPEDDVKSPGADADPGAVAQLTWSAQHTFGGRRDLDRERRRGGGPECLRSR